MVASYKFQVLNPSVNLQLGTWNLIVVASAQLLISTSQLFNFSTLLHNPITISLIIFIDRDAASQKKSPRGMETAFS
jgi:hypothetical protein